MTSTGSGTAPTYMMDVDYPVTFSASQAPVHLDYVCALNGVAGPGRDGVFRYCELGCGAGKTVAVLAAAYPEGEFFGIDLNPDHIAYGQALAAAGGLANARFLAADVTALDPDSLPDFDFVTMEGLYAWVPAEVRRAILSFIRAKLRPGGVVNVSYNTLPGWSAMGHIRQYFHDRARCLKGEPTDIARQILGEIEMMREARIPFFADHQVASSIMETVAKQDLRYVVHEFLTPSWQPMAFADVAAAMASAGLAFVGDTQVVHNFIEHAVPDALLDLARATEDRLCQERTKDLIVNRSFRSDVYIRPRDDSVSTTAKKLLAETVFGIAKPPAELSNTIDIPLGKIELKGTSVERLRNVLMMESLSLAEIFAHPALRDCAPDELVQSVKLFSIDQQIVPFARRAKSPSGPPPLRVGCPLELNRVLLAQSADAIVVLASPTAGNGVVVNPLEACLLLALFSDDPTTTAVAEIRRRGLPLTQDGKPLESEAALRAAVDGLLPQYGASRLPKLAALGVVEAW